MITYVEGDLFQSPAKVLVNTVNTVGVMGKGIALQFKRYYPEMFKRYQTLCERNQFRVGQLWLYRTNHKWILNFPTKKHWREKSRTEYIKMGLEKFVATYDQKGITSISFPKLGCGNGELDWELEVRPLMEDYLAALPIDVYIHLYPTNALVPEHRDVRSMQKWLHGEPETLAFTEFWDDLVNLVARRSSFSILGGKGDFRASADDAGLTILEGTGRSIQISKDEEMLELWQFVRAAGYCLGDRFPVGLDAYSDCLVSMLSGLEYLEPVVLSLAGHNERRQIGLQLIPPTKPSAPRSEQIAFDLVMQKSE